MKVFIDHHEVIIFDGASVGDAILAYSKQQYRKVLDGQVQVIDCFGYLTEPDGKVSEGQAFTLKEKT